MDDAAPIGTLLVHDDVVVARRARACLGWATAEVTKRWEAEARLGELELPHGGARFWLELMHLLAQPHPAGEERELLEFLALVEEFEAD